MDTEPSFIVDNNVGKLAPWLRALGYDTLFINPIEDGVLVEIARREGRTVLTKDTGIMRRRVITSGEVPALLVRGDAWRDQLRQVVEAYGLGREAAFTRCLACNGPLERVTRDEARPHVPPFVHHTRSDFQHCPGCGRYYWPGTHRERIRQELRRTLNGSAPD